MTTFVNIRIDSDMMIDPSLKVLVDKLTLVNPKWVFSSNKKTSKYETMIDYKGYNPSTEHRAPEGFQFVRALDVRENDELLGNVGVDTHYRSNADQRFIWYMSSWRINKSRGRQHSTQSLKVETIVRECKKLFKPKNKLELFEKGSELLSERFGRAMRDLTAPIDHGRHIRSTAGVQVLAYYLLNDIPVVDAEVVNTRNALMTDGFKKAVEEYELAGSVYHSNRYAVVEVGDGMFMYEHEGEVVCKSFDELTQSQQDKIAVLQLMQDNEMVRDVGFRASAGKYYLI
jgi:hypothetical protein